jgi:hypothetical protein
MKERGADMPARDEDVGALAELAEEMTCRLETGEPVTAGDLGSNAKSAGAIRQLLPTLRAMVSLGEQIIREEGSRVRSRKKKEMSSSFADTNPDVEELKP